MPSRLRQRKDGVKVTSFDIAHLTLDGSLYGGYYDDVLPSDDGEYRQGLDPKTIKKIAYILAGVLVIVALCVVALYLM